MAFHLVGLIFFLRWMISASPLVASRTAIGQRFQQAVRLGDWWRLDILFHAAGRNHKYLNLPARWGVYNPNTNVPNKRQSARRG